MSAGSIFFLAMAAVCFWMAISTGWALLTRRHARRREYVLRELLRRGTCDAAMLVLCSNGLLSQGSVYVFLSRLEDEGVIEGYTGIGYGRRMYRLPRSAA